MKLARVRTPVVARLNLYNSLYLFQKSSSMDLMKLTLRRDSYHKAAAVRTGNNVAGMRRDAFLAQCNLNYVQYVFGWLHLHSLVQSSHIWLQFVIVRLRVAWATPESIPCPRWNMCEMGQRKQSLKAIGIASLLHPPY